MTDKLKLYIASQVRTQRKAAGLSQAELADRIDRTSEAISNIERAKSLPALDTLIAIATALEVPLRAFFPGDEEGETRGLARVRVEAEAIAVLRGLSDGRAKIALAQMRALAEG